MMNTYDTKQVPYVLDVEASGFGASSYPIEVGVITPSQQRYCALISPCGDWSHWDPEAEALHGINRSLLEKRGKAIHQVCIELNELLAGQTVYTDGWVVDYPWMIRLFDAARMDMAFSISPLELLLTEYQMEQWDKIRNMIEDKQSLTRHRASSDAECIQQVFIQTRQVQGAA